MINFNDLDKSKYYYMYLVGYEKETAVRYRGIEAYVNLTYHRLLDIIRNIAYDVDDNVYKEMRKRKDIEIIKSGHIADGKELIVRTDGETSRGIITYKRGNKRTTKNSRVRYDERRVSESTVMFKDVANVENLRDLRLLTFGVMDFNTDTGTCRINNKKLNTVYIPDGVISLEIDSSTINSVVLGKHCKTVEIKDSVINSMNAVNAHRVEVISGRIQELTVSNKTGVLRGWIERIDGSMSLLDVTEGRLELKSPGSILDLTNSLWGRSMQCSSMECDKLILPKSARDVKVSGDTVKEIHCNGYVEFFRTYLRNEKTKLVFNGGIAECELGRLYERREYTPGLEIVVNKRARKAL